MEKELSMDQVFIKQLETAIETHLEDEKFGVEELAKELLLSRSQLHRKLEGLTGKSTSQYIREFRLEKAMEMLQNNVATASEIAYRVGFGSPTYFNTSFNKYYGYPPGEVKFRNPSKDENNVHISLNESEILTIKRRFYNLRSYVIGTLAGTLILFFGYYIFANSEPTETEKVKEVNSGENSIAVLPFKNLSGDADNEAFCDGMTIAIISRLSKIKDINKVISQTSVMSFKETLKTMPEIANELGVHYVLESGFQKSGNDIKINLQLIDGASDKLYWSEEYEGKFDSIFKIQAQVAEMVAKQMNADITEEEQKNIQQTMTNNTEAYEKYLLGKHITSTCSPNNFNAARRLFKKAIELDSTFAEAYFQYGYTYTIMGTWNGNMTMKEANELAQPYFDKALQLNPINQEYLRRMIADANFNWNFKKADSLVKISDNFGNTFDGDRLYFFMGNNDRIVEHYFKSLEDPSRNEDDPNIVWRALPYALYYKGEIDEAKHVMEVGLKYHSNMEAFYDHFGNLYLAMGDYEKAKDLLETGILIAGKRIFSSVIHLAITHHFLGDEEKSLELLNEAINRAKKGEPEVNVFVAHYYARIGNKDEAFKWLDIAYKKHEVDLNRLKADPNLKLLENDSRYNTLVKKIGFLEI